MNWSNYYSDLTIPADWQNVSSGNDVMPSFYAYDEFQIFIDSHDPSIRAINTEDITGSSEPLLPRFNVERISSDGDTVEIFRSDSFAEVLEFLKFRTSTDNCIECNRSTAFGTGLYVNRIPAENGFLCPDCQQVECASCAEMTSETYFNESFNDVVCYDCRHETDPHEFRR